MTSKEILAFITEVGMVPIVRTSSAESAIQAVEAIYAGGVRAAEITMTVPGAIHALEKVADKFGGKIVLGAGTTHNLVCPTPAGTIDNGVDNWLLDPLSASARADSHAAGVASPAPSKLRVFKEARPF